MKENLQEINKLKFKLANNLISWKHYLEENSSAVFTVRLNNVLTLLRVSLLVKSTDKSVTYYNTL